MAKAKTAGAISGAASGAASGAMIGSVIPGIGTVAGAIGGGLIGGLSGLFGGSDFVAPKRASSTVYGYDMNGNLVNKGSFQYNSATGKYELRGGELSADEKKLRNNLAQNIGNLINTVGSTPDAFVRYAKELSNAYMEQGQRRLDEKYEEAQTKLDESLARRGLSTSRASADLTSELQGERLSALQDLYGQAQNYGYNVQSGLQSQARGALSTLAGYQGQLQSQDQNYLSQALAAQKLGQEYENAKVGITNKNIQQSNKAWQSIGNTLTDFGTLAGYYLATNAGGQTGAPSAEAVQGVKDVTTPNYLSQYFSAPSADDYFNSLW